MTVRKSIEQLQKDLGREIDKAGDYYLGGKIPADLGNHSGVVRVPGTQNMVYVRLPNGQVLEVFNGIAPAIYNWKVFIGRDKSQPNLLKVLEVRWVYNMAETVAYVLFHHQQHEYPAPDTVWVHRDQFLPMLVLPAGGFNVRVYGDYIYTPSMAYPIRVANETTVDLSAYGMIAGAHYVLMEVKPDGTFNYVVGSTYGSIEVLRNEAPFPTPTEGNFPICVIEFYDGQTSIRRDSIERNIIDLRMFVSNVPTGAGSQWHGSPVISPIDDLDEYGIYDVSEGTLKKITHGSLRASMFNDGEGDPAPISRTAASDGTSLYAARRDHVHLSTTQMKIVMQPSAIDPPVPVLTPDGDDYVYYDA
jgi:hypothetical protein